MAWMILLAAVGACVVFAIYYRQSRRRRATAVETQSKRLPAGEFQSVEIRIGGRACAEVKRLAGARYLVSMAPRLPLAKCTAARCTCAYTKLADRREEPRRWSDQGLGASIFSAQEQRSGGDRRSD